MTIAIVDTNILIEILRRNTHAVSWFAAQTDALSITPIIWLEVMDGAQGKSGQVASKGLLDRFAMVYFVEADQDWTMAQVLTHRLSKGVEFNDCFIAAVCYRLQVPVYTHNVKDMLKILPKSLIVDPYRIR